MKFIPLDSLERITSLVHGVEALGCLVTVELSAFTCRHTREEKQIAENLASYYATALSTPPISPSPVSFGNAAGTFSEDAMNIMAPQPLVLGSSVEQSHSPALPVSAEDIDERLVYMVAALNNLYEEEGYDFSILTENDFLNYSEAQMKAEIAHVLDALPPQCGPAVQSFWPAIEEQVLDEAQGCEYYEFSCPSCNPRASCVFSHQFFLYSKRRKVLVAILIYGEGNQYRGDDGCDIAQGAHLEYVDDYYEDSRQYMSTPEPMNDEDEEYVGKNRDFYGY